MTNCIMDGVNVFVVAISKTPKSAKQLIEHYEIDLGKIDYLLLHQANNLIDEKIIKKLKYNPNQVPMSLKKFGNTSACSIPLNIVSEIREDLQGKRVDTVMSAIHSLADLPLRSLQISDRYFGVISNCLAYHCTSRLCGSCCKRRMNSWKI